MQSAEIAQNSNLQNNLDFQINAVSNQCYEKHDRIQSIALRLIALLSFVGGHVIKHASRSLTGFTLLNVAAKSTQMGLFCLLLYTVFKWSKGEDIFNTKYKHAWIKISFGHEKYKNFLSAIGQEPTVDNALQFHRQYKII